MTTTNAYVFNGKKLLSYSHFDIYREALVKEGIEVTSTSFNEIFEEINGDFPDRKREADRLFFENIFYGQLKNIYFHKVTNDLPEKNAFLHNVARIINNMNKKESIPAQHHDSFNINGFYALDILNIETKGNVFLLGYDFKENNDRVELARFLIAQVVIKDDEPVYYLAALEINYLEKFYLLMFRNLIGIDAVPQSGLLEEEKWNRTMNGYITKINNFVLSPLDIIESFQVKKDRAGMYDMCKKLDDDLLEEYRAIVTGKINSSVENSIDDWFDALFTDGEGPSAIQKESLKDKICSQVLALYLKNNPQIDLVEKARALGQVGYTTKIEFKANQAGRGATKSKSGSEPIVSEDMFHSLYIDFKGALELPKWSLAWFTDETDDYLQTTIYITNNYFKVIFLPTRHLDKEAIYRVVRYIGGFRNY
ncbi:hypothetical protein QP794_25650 [Paenibacillus sp. UMB7766-LJ446]|uniref:hypothetical protein n=1 Tax=Paenibacillus sp. UMB7766-LJ446 TaxID=3046313 RepID=UPI002549C6C3|nr:hypothetical protein [Paenibacillus sp. UMB7766-LJ446]MDK8193480.1 hypothetical protein [Paenibacillus sp. UMB7766-LJ446]